MDYTTAIVLKTALHIQADVENYELKRFVTAVSRAIDHIAATGSVEDAATDYFKREAVTNEYIKGQIDIRNRLICYPRKSQVVSVQSLSYRSRPGLEWRPLEDLNLVVVENPHVEAWLNYAPCRGPVFVQVSYTGGHGATENDLPKDFEELATILAGRFYREDESGLTDAIGVAELGTLTYTQALPERFKYLIQPFMRRVPW